MANEEIPESRQSSGEVGLNLKYDRELMEEPSPGRWNWRISSWMWLKP